MTVMQAVQGSQATQCALQTMNDSLLLLKKQSVLSSLPILAFEVLNLTGIPSKVVRSILQRAEAAQVEHKSSVLSRSIH